MEEAPKQTIDSEVYEKKYKEAKERLLQIFQNKNEREIEELYSEIRRFYKILDWDPEEIIEEIKKVFNQEDPEVFVEATFNAVKKLIDKTIEHRQDFERARREAIIQHHGNIKLSKLMYYDVDLENGAARIHIAPKGDMKLGEIVKSFREGMKKLAEHVRDDERIKEIQTTSWIVASNPGLLEKAGFSVEGEIDEKTKIEHFSEETRPVFWARMSRETLLEKYSQ